jgi:hypothetical protein
MSMITGARTWVDLEAPEPLGGGVLSVARVVDTTGTALMGVEAETDACATAEEWAEWCTMTPTGRKLFESAPDYVVGDPFALYAGVSCDLQRLEESKTRAEARLDYGESRGVDQHIDAQLAADADVVDLGGPFGVAEAVGIAEAFAATVYGGKPTLLIPRQVIPCGGTTVFESSPGGTLTTLTGSRVAPLTTAVAVPTVSGPVTMYVTGQITVLRGPVLSVSVPQQINGNGPTFAPMRALAERIFVPVFDCLVAKLEVSCS